MKTHDDTFDHEKAILLVMKEGDAPGAAFEALLDHPDVVTYAFPPPWVCEQVGVDLHDAMPELRTFTRENLSDALDVLVRLHTDPVLQEKARRVWQEADEAVRSFFLQRGLLGSVASMVRLAPKTRHLPPPKDFVQGQVFIHRFEMQYRLRREGSASMSDVVAPPEEGSLVFYPFDPANHEAREEADLGQGHAPVLEAFAYMPARARHRKVLEDVAHRRGWRVIDTAETSK